MTWVKVCGLTREGDVEAAVALGADAVGFVLEPTSPREVRPERASDLAALSGNALSVAVIGAFNGAAPKGIQAVQAIDHQAPSPLVRIKTVRLQAGMMPVEVANRAEGFDYVHLDAFHPKALGGTGQTVDWGLAAEIVAISRARVILSGGLGPENIEQAVVRVKPFGVDASSGLESSPGIKDLGLLRAYIQAAKSK